MSCPSVGSGWLRSSLQLLVSCRGAKEYMRSRWDQSGLVLVVDGIFQFVAWIYNYSLAC